MRILIAHSNYRWPGGEESTVDRLAETLVEGGHTVEASDFRLMKEHGFSDDDIWDIGAITALFALSNRMASLLALRPNDEFYRLGRDKD